jgi:ferritin
MIPERVQEAINTQIGHELESAYAYLGMSTYCQSVDMAGFATWLRAQAREEVEHAMKFLSFVEERGGQVRLPAVGEASTRYDSILHVFETALAQERKVSALIHDIYALAVEEKDYPTQVMLQWFITEQVEEESTFEQMVGKLRRMGESRDAIFLLDRDAAERSGEEAG